MENELLDVLKYNVSNYKFAAINEEKKVFYFSNEWEEILYRDYTMCRCKYINISYNNNCLEVNYIPITYVTPNDGCMNSCSYSNSCYINNFTEIFKSVEQLKKHYEEKFDIIDIDNEEIYIQPGIKGLKYYWKYLFSFDIVFKYDTFALKTRRFLQNTDDCKRITFITNDEDITIITLHDKESE